MLVWMHLALCVSMWAAETPAIAIAGLANAASHTPLGLSGGIAQGALLTIRGANFGSSSDTTAVEIRTPQGRFRAPLVEVTSKRIIAWLPREAPPGAAALMVTANGAASEPRALTILHAGFGILSRNEQGWGPGRIENIASDGTRSANSTENSARPGQRIRLLGTGLGQGARMEAVVGGKPARVVSSRKALAKGAAPAWDEMVLQVPADVPEGCYVPVQVTIDGGVPSNHVTISAHRGGRACVVPESFPMSGWKSGKAAVVLVSRTVQTDIEEPGQTIKDEAAAIFFDLAGKRTVNGALLIAPPAGTCTTYTSIDEEDVLFGSTFPALAMAELEGGGLDAGPSLGIANGGVQRRMRPLTGAPGTYWITLGGRSSAPLLFDPVPLRVAGLGGEGVGPFVVSVPGPEPFEWVNQEQLAVVNRTRGMRLEWRAGKDKTIAILAASIDLDRRLRGVCFCIAAGEKESFTIPPSLLASLPATPTGAGPVLSVVSLASWPLREFRAVQAPGVTHGFAAGVYVRARGVRFQ